jgi:hypothetical protein
MASGCGGATASTGNTAVIAWGKSSTTNGTPDRRGIVPRGGKAFPLCGVRHLLLNNQPFIREWL